ncbi:unnamed protein product [Acanthosepion pharaonis]|uniref:Uncharacterized protein n=1 Tax=Acanthosepion pharaonis TaxID=158019 RepID=A0A812BTW2_ACAPH|nr:unnamed protein product [Sepia pharaonis]
MQCLYMRRLTSLSLSLFSLSLSLSLSLSFINFFSLVHPLFPISFCHCLPFGQISCLRPTLSLSLSLFLSLSPTRPPFLSYFPLSVLLYEILFHHSIILALSEASGLYPQEGKPTVLFYVTFHCHPSFFLSFFLSLFIYLFIHSFIHCLLYFILLLYCLPFFFLSFFLSFFFLSRHKHFLSSIRD